MLMFLIVGASATMSGLAPVWHVLCICLSVCITSMDAKETLLYTNVGVLNREETTNITRHILYKREVHKDMVGFNRKQKLEMLRRHNLLRSKRKASNMMMMDWDSDLEKMAQDWAEQCIFEHSQSRYNKAGFRYIGENLFATTGSFDPADVVQAWYDEVVDYDYNTLGCKPGKPCGHYTQVVWDSSNALGCGVKYCDPLLEVDFKRGYNIVCHYGPGGNIIGRKPYALGPPCSQCPAETEFCVNGLCSLRPQIGSSSDWIQSCRPQNRLLFLLIFAFHLFFTHSAFIVSITI